MMKKTKIGAAVLMAAFAMMTVQPMTSMAAGICQTRICGGNSVNLYGTVLATALARTLEAARQETIANQEGSRIIVPVEVA